MASNRRPQAAHTTYKHTHTPPSPRSEPPITRICNGGCIALPPLPAPDPGCCSRRHACHTCSCSYGRHSRAAGGGDGALTHLARTVIVPASIPPAPLPLLQPAEAAAVLAAMGEPSREDSSPVLADCETSVVGTAARHNTINGATVLLETAVSTGAVALPTDAALRCECEDVGCECDKTCLCRIRSGAEFGGDRLEPPADLAGLAPATPLHDCACNIGEVGGPGFDAGNTVDCDCARASCACKRRCRCAPV